MGAKDVSLIQALPTGPNTREAIMPHLIDLKDQKINNPQAEFEKPSDIVEDSELSHKQKKKALETLQEDAHQLLTASNEGMAPADD